METGKVALAGSSCALWWYVMVLVFAHTFIKREKVKL